MDPKTVILKYLLFLAVTVHLSSAACHSLQYSCTGVTRGLNSLEYTVEGQLDGEPFGNYDSSTENVTLKTEWIKKVDADGPKQWEDQKRKLQSDQKSIKTALDITMQSFSQTEGVHRVQWTCRCELDDNGTERGYWRYRYDGEDFLSLDLDPHNETWTAETPQAKTTKLKLEQTPVFEHQKAFLNNECIEWLQMYRNYRRSTQEKTGSRKRRSFDENTECWARQNSSPEHEASGGGSNGIIIAVVAVLLLVLIGCVGVFIWKKKKSVFKRVPQGNSSSNNLWS